MSSSALAGPLAATPPMGWSSNEAGCEVSEQLVRASADAMVTTGMQRVGYEYLVLDDCWQGARDKEGFLQPDPTRFPSGMKALADYVHGKGFKLGIHASGDYLTPSGKPGSRGHEYQDALQFGRWGVDYLDYSWKANQDLPAPAAYATLVAGVNATRRPMVLRVADSGASEPWTWAPTVAQLWDTSQGSYECFTCVAGQGEAHRLGVLPASDALDGLRRFAGPGHWNSPGLLQVGKTMTPPEERAQVALWSMLAAPLLTTTPLTTLSGNSRAVLMNPEAIAIDQDSLGIQGFRYRTDGELDVWVRPLSRGRLAVLFVNRTRTPVDVSFDWQVSPIADDLTHKRYDFASTTYSVRDVWEHEERGDTQEPLATTLQSHEVLWLRLTPQK